MTKPYQYILILFCVLVCKTATAQNLVPNPGFEDYNVCPDQFFYDTIAFSPDYSNFPMVKDWVAATQGAGPQYFNSCDIVSNHGIPYNIFGYQVPHAGNAYMGFNAYMTVSLWRVVFAEYLECRLIQPLIAGHRYYAGFYLNFAEVDPVPAGFGYAAVDNFGAHFSNSEIAVPYVTNFVGVEYLSNVPQVNSVPGHFFTDSANWEKVQGGFTAAGGERWMTIGNFVLDTPIAYHLMDTVPVPYGNYACYMYCDDVCVVDMDNNAIPSSSDTFVCVNALPVLLPSHTSADDYIEWYNGDTAKSITIQDTGRYWYKRVTNCELYVDTIIVHALPSAHPVITIIGMTFSTGPYASYQWYRNGQPIPGATSQSYTATQEGDYYVVVTAAAGCGGVSDTIHIFSEGVDTYTYDKKVSLFPNPVHDILQVNGNTIRDGLVTITDITGKAVISAPLNAQSFIDLHGLAKGIYLYKITDKDGFLQQSKLLKD